MKSIIYLFIIGFIIGCRINNQTEKSAPKYSCKIEGPTMYSEHSKTLTNYAFYYDCSYFNNYLDYIHLSKDIDTLIAIKRSRTQELLNFDCCGDYTNYQSIFIYKDTLTAIKIDITNKVNDTSKQSNFEEIKSYYSKDRQRYDERNFTKTLYNNIWQKDSSIYRVIDYIYTFRGIQTYFVEIVKENDTYRLDIEYASKIMNGNEIMEKRKFALGILDNIYIQRTDVKDTIDRGSLVLTGVEPLF